MSDDFDHYYKWLGIPPADQPPNHYRLLGLPNFTDDPEVIANAADQRAAHLRTFQLGPRSALSQQILNEVARARVCLLAPDMKAAYDAQLRATFAVPEEPQPATAMDVAATPTLDATRTGSGVFFGPATDQLKTLSPKKTPDPLPLNVAQKPANTTKHLPREQRTKKKSNPYIEVAKIIGGGVAGLAIGYLLVCWISPNNDFLGLRKSLQSKQVVTSSDALSLQPEINGPPADNEPATSPEEKPVAARSGSTQQASAVEPPPSGSPSTGASQTSATPPVVEVANEPALPIESDEQRLQRLTEERDAALAKGDIDAALKAVEVIAGMTNGDALDRKLAFVDRLLSSATTSKEIQRTTEHLLRLLHEAVDANRKDLADRHTDQVIAGARQSGDNDLIRWSTLCVLKIQNM